MLQGAGAPPGGQRGTAPNQYRSADARERACASYDAILKRWPVPYEARLLETRFGDTHVITFGAEGARPLVLLHGLGTNATSWFPLVPALAARHRVHAIDTIGDVGKSAGTRPSYGSGDQLAALRVPALLVLGRNDPIYDATRAANRVRAVAPQIRIEIIRDGGHLFVSHRPADTSKALLEFFGP